MKNQVTLIDKYFKKPPLIVGSYALNNRYAKDIDCITTLDNIKILSLKGDDYLKSFDLPNERRVECLILDTQPTLQKIYNYYKQGKINLNTLMFILKYGHVHIGLKGQFKFERNINDYHYLKRLSSNNKLVRRLCLEYRKETNNRIKQKTPKLKNVSKENFFDDYVEKYVEHDSIHDIVKYEEIPMYKKLQKDETVTCHKDLWLQLSFDQKINCVVEECTVIAIERRLLPEKIRNNIKTIDFVAFNWALFRVCTTLCSGWFRQFAIDNYFTILNKFNTYKINENLNTTYKMWVNKTMTE